MIGRWLCRRHRHAWLVFPRPLVLEHPRHAAERVTLAGVCTRCRALARWNVPGA